jgi:hypothetical protein
MREGGVSPRDGLSQPNPDGGTTHATSQACKTRILLDKVVSPTLLINWLGCQSKHSNDLFGVSGKRSKMFLLRFEPKTSDLKAETTTLHVIPWTTEEYSFMMQHNGKEPTSKKTKQLNLQLFGVLFLLRPKWTLLRSLLYF